MMNLRRTKQNQNLIQLTDSSSLSHKKMIQPIFCVEGLHSKESLESLNNVYRDTETTILETIESDQKKGVQHFLLFLVPKTKSNEVFPNQFIERTIGSIKRKFPDIFLWLDTCFCSYSTHGHCGQINQMGEIDNSLSLITLSKLALLYAQSGADGIAPSDMMDGRVASHRRILDENQFSNVPILSYSTKFKSNFYGPFRSLADSKPQVGDRSTYQLFVGDRETAIRASIRDANEGADLLMVKPGMTSIDLLSEIQKKTLLPVGAYQVSSEYAAINLLAENQFLKREDALIETWQVFQRAGASFLISYAAREAKELWI
ncbi:delta-aminolevulinic acid dehydratase [Leptospira ryugenii]|uniref:Delta-aminolevulinic acid dehydratase n=1 Tax=Leptospira ryugenii TaxID=1917863 RepID=A0A2P2DVC6_9LEPT|nr:porphobilinogen synthase [Leptospira ryugenii]GBF48608.1 delta-aminolevulinic acid dehydratase [Leptospira ryugenii]